MTRKPNKRRCTATNLDGVRCAKWAMRRSDPPRCSVHGVHLLAADDGRRCTAKTKEGKRCRNVATQGHDLCSVHAGLNFVDEAARRAGRVCTANNRFGLPCGRWAVPGSHPPLCAVHGPRQLSPRTAAPPGRRCQALTKNGQRCQNWTLPDAPPQHALCNIHTAGYHGPQPQKRCTATTRAGRPCSRWAVPGSAQQYGQRLCKSHLPDGDPRQMRFHGPGTGERRCRARTLDGRRCRLWALSSDALQKADLTPGRQVEGLCWTHAFPHLNPHITHGYYRRIPTFSPAEQAAILRLAEEGRPLAAELLLVRLKVRDAFAYMGRKEVRGREETRVANLILKGVDAVLRLRMAQEALAKLTWGPTSAGGTGKMLEQMRRQHGD